MTDVQVAPFQVRQGKGFKPGLTEEGAKSYAYLENGQTVLVRRYLRNGRVETTPAGRLYLSLFGPTADSEATCAFVG